MAPVGSAHLHVRRSAQVASFLGSRQPPAKAFVAAPPGGKRKIGHTYQVLQPVVEEAGDLQNSAPSQMGFKLAAGP